MEVVLACFFLKVWKKIANLKKKKKLKSEPDVGFYPLTNPPRQHREQRVHNLSWTKGKHPSLTDDSSWHQTTMWLQTQIHPPVWIKTFCTENTLSCPPARAWLPAAPMRTPPAHTQNRHPRWSSSGSPATTSPSFPQRATPSPSPVVSDAPGSLHTSSADRGGKRILESHWQNLKYNIFNFIFLILALFVQDLYYFYAIYIATEVSLIAPNCLHSLAY